MNFSTTVGSLILLCLTIPSTQVVSQIFSPANIGALAENYDSRALWADLDNDGDPDLVLTGGQDAPVAVYKNSGGTLVFHTSTNLPTLLSPIFGAADFNKDGYVDLVMSGIVEGGNVVPVMGAGIYLNDGTGQFTKSTASLVALSLGSVDCADFDLDGDTDILMTGYDKSQEVRTVIMMNNNDGSFTELSHQLPGVGADNGANGAWGDYDWDGDPDILLSGRIYDHGTPTGLTRIFTNNGDRTFSEAPVSLAQYSGKSEWVDVNNDGALDVFVSGDIMGSLTYCRLYLNQSGSFVEGPAVPFTYPFFDFHWIDFDNDGDKDLLAAEGSDGVISIYVNNAGVSFTKLESFSVPNYTQTSVTDFDSDGHYDVFLSGYTDGFTASNLALRNDSSTPNVAPGPPTNLIVNGSGREVTFSWDAATDPETSGTPLEYVLRVGTSAGSSDVVSPLTTIPGHNLAVEFLDAHQTTSRLVYDLPNGTYYASVQAVDHSGKVSIPSNEVTFMVTDAPAIPLAPDNLRLAITTTNFVELNWLDQSTNENTFEIERSDDGVSFQLLTAVTSNTMRYVDKSVALDKEYAYRLRAVNATGSSDYTTAQSILNPKGIFRKLEGFELDATESDPSISVNWVDYDGDGFEDLFMASSLAANLLYQNQGDGSFQKITSGALISGNVQNRTSCWADYDNDGDMDVFIPTPYSGRLFRNDAGTFTEITASPFNEITSDCGGASWVDYDNDGFLDLSVVYNQSPSNLFHNNGNGTFSKVTEGEFVKDAGTFSGIAWCDYNNDGWQDALAVNPGGELIFYKNTKGLLVKVIDPVNAAGSGALSASWGDYDNDGDFDLFIGTNSASDTFFQNNGNGSFTRISNAVTEAYIQANASSWADIDNDGNLDLFLTGDTERTLFLNTGNGSFQMQEDEPATSGTRYTAAVAFGDYDKDGFLDAAFPSHWEDPAVLRNNGNDNNHWVSFYLEGTATNRNAIGAKVTITAGGEQMTNYIASQTGHSSQNSFNVHFGLGPSTTIDSVVVAWPLRGFQTLSDIAADQFMTIIEPAFPTAPVLAGGEYDSTTERVSINWDQTAGATKYVVERSVRNQEGFQTAGVENSSILEFSEDMPVEMDSAFYRVLAVEGNNASWYSDVESVFCGLRSPQNPQATIEPDGIRLTWDDMSDREIQYEVFRSVNGTDFEKLVTVANNVTQYNDLTATEEQITYYYTLQAVSGQVRSHYCDTTSVTRPLNAPGDLAVTLDGGAVVLHWTDNSMKETSYVIERSSVNQQQFGVIATVPPNTVEFRDEGFSIGEQLFYRVRAGNAEGQSVYSGDVNMLVSGTEETVARLVEVYPNPAKAILNIKAPPGKKMFSITNMVGVEVMSRSSTSEITALEIRSLPPGVYIMSTVISGTIVRKKVSVKGH